MHNKLLTSIRAFAVYAILLGLIYPLGITYISQLTMPVKANGSLLYKNGAVIGSALIGQEFTDAKYFHSRFSSTNYDAVNSDGSTFAAGSKSLIEQTSLRLNKVRFENNLNSQTDLPADMVLLSGSGLDPHISLANVHLQMPRVAAARNLPLNVLKTLVAKNLSKDFVGIWGQAGVNVLKLNLALDNFTNKQREKQNGHLQAN